MKKITPERKGQALGYLNPLCKKQDTRSWHVMGYCHLNGILGPQNTAKARQCFIEAADQGYVQAQTSAGCLLLNKARGTQDKTKRDKEVQQGIQYLVRACEKGSVRAANALLTATLLQYEEFRDVSGNQWVLEGNEWPLNLADFLIEKNYLGAPTIKGQYLLKHNQEKEAKECFEKAGNNRYINALDASLLTIKEANIKTILSETTYYDCTEFTPTVIDHSEPGYSYPNVLLEFPSFNATCGSKIIVPPVEEKSVLQTLKDAFTLKPKSPREEKSS